MFRTFLRILLISVFPRHSRKILSFILPPARLFTAELEILVYGENVLRYENIIDLPDLHRVRTYVSLSRPIASSESGATISKHIHPPPRCVYQ